MTKDIIDAIKERRCIRSFTGEMVPHATVGRLLEAAHWAPSAGNLQPWQFYVVYNRAKKNELARAALDQGFVADAPVVIVVCALPELSAARYSQRGRLLYCLQDTAAAVQNILLAADGFGLASCWVGAFDDDEVRSVLDLSPDFKPVAILPVGYPAEERKPPARRPIDEIVYVIEEDSL